MKLIALFMLFTISSSFAAVDPLFGKVIWSYEVFDDEPDGTFTRSIDKGSLSSGNGLKTGEKIKIPLQSIECFANIPWIPKETSEVLRQFHCNETGKAEIFSMSSSISCGPSKTKDSSTTMIYGKFCEAKKCHGKNIKVVFSCSV
jgi:hypothetical protein